MLLSFYMQLSWYYLYVCNWMVFQWKLFFPRLWFHGLFWHFSFGTNSVYVAHHRVHKRCIVSHYCSIEKNGSQTTGFHFIMLRLLGLSFYIPTLCIIQFGLHGVCITSRMLLYILDISLDLHQSHHILSLIMQWESFLATYIEIPLAPCWYIFTCSRQFLFRVGCCHYHLIMFMEAVHLH